VGQRYTRHDGVTPTTPVSLGITRPQLTVCFTRRFFNSKNFAGSAALAEVSALLSAILGHVWSMT